MDDQQLMAIVAGAQYEIRRLQERGSHLSALLKAIERFDEVAAAIRSAYSRDDVRDAVLASPARLVGTERGALLASKANW